MRRRLLLPAVLISIFARSSLHAQVPEGMAALQAYDRSHATADAQKAARFFVQALKANPNDANAHYGLGLALFRAPKTMAYVRAQGMADGEAIFAAQREIEKALALNPQFGDAAAALADIARRTGDNEALTRARTVLEKTQPGGNATQEVQLALGDNAAILDREPVTALDYLRRAVVLFKTNRDEDGWQSYSAGIERWDAASVQAYLDHVLVIATDEEYAALTGGSLSDKRAALQLFWKKRAVRDGVSEARRAGEYYRRLEYARAHFALMRRAPAFLEPALRRRNTVIGDQLDHRGLVYLHYGAPVRADTLTGTEFCPGNETWTYYWPDGQKFYFSFKGTESNKVWRQDAMDLICDTDEIHTYASAVADLSRFDPRYGLIAVNILAARDAAWAGNRDLANEYKQSIQDRSGFISRSVYANVAQAMRTDVAVPIFHTRPLVFHDLATFRGNGCTDVVYSLAAKASSYRIAVAIADTTTWQTQRVDTAVSHEPVENGLLRSTGVLCTNPRANAYVRFTLTTGPDTGAVAGGSIAIPDYTGKALMMSDLLFATNQPGPFTRGVAHLAIVPPRQFKQNEPFRLFYELYNLPRGAKYRTDISFETADPNLFAKLFVGKKKTTVSFDDVAASDDVVQELRTLIPQIEAGKVLVTVKVTDLTSTQTASKSETIWVLP